MNKTAKKILNFSYPVLQSQRIAIALNQLLVGCGIHRTNAFAGEPGVVRVTGYYEDHYMEFTVEFNGTLTCTHEIGDEVVAHREGISFGEAETFIKEMENDSTSV